MYCFIYKGYVDVYDLLDQLKSTKYERVVQSSSCLSLLIQSDNDELEGIMETIAGCSLGLSKRNTEEQQSNKDVEGGGEGGGTVKFISKTEFVEFCGVLSDIRIFNFVG